MQTRHKTAGKRGPKIPCILVRNGYDAHSNGYDHNNGEDDYPIGSGRWLVFMAQSFMFWSSAVLAQARGPLVRLAGWLVVGDRSCHK